MTTNLLALAQHKLYLQSRIALLVQKHADYKVKESETPESDHKLALNSSAACIWDAKCEIDSALEHLIMAEEKSYPFIPLSCNLYEYSGPAMKIQLPDGTKVDISLPDGEHGTFFEQLNKLLNAGTSMALGYSAEWKHEAADDQQPPVVLSFRNGVGATANVNLNKLDVFDLLANATRPATLQQQLEEKFFWGSDTPTDVPKAIVDVQWKESRPIGNKDEPIVPDTEGKVEPFIVEPDDSNSMIGHDD